MNAEEPHDPLAIQKPCRQYGMDEEIHPVQVAAFRRMSVGQKLDAMSRLYKISRQMLANQIRRQHPDWDAQKIEAEVSQRFANGIS